MKRLYTLLLSGALLGNLLAAETPASSSAVRPVSAGAVLRTPENPAEPSAKSYRLSYSDGILNVTYCDVTSLCGKEDARILMFPDGSDSFEFHLFSDCYYWGSQPSEEAYVFDLSETFDRFAPGRYEFEFDYVKYDVDLYDGLDIILTPADASPGWNYSRDSENSDCKNGRYSAPSDPGYDSGDEDYWEDQYHPSYEVKYAGGVLHLTWRYVSATCGAKFKGATYRKEGRRLTFYLQEYFDTALADCICRYDVATTFDGIEPGDYLIVLDGKEYPLTLTDATDVVLDQGNIATGIEVSAADGILLSIYQGVARVEAGNCGYLLEVFTPEGTRIAAVSGHGDEEVDLSSLPRGIYALRLSASGKSVSRIITLQ